MVKRIDTQSDGETALPAHWRPEVVFSGERMVPERVDHGNLVYHLRRYTFAKQFVAGKRVLDAGCGIGYGSQMLASVAASVVAVDYCPDAVLYARENHPASNLRHVAGDVTRLGFRDHSFDVVVSLEVFEHILEYRAYLDEVRRLLVPGGMFVMSTPNGSVDQVHMESIGFTYEYHVNLVGLKVLRDLLAERYDQVTVYGLRRKGNALYTALRALDVFNLRLRLVSPKRRERANAVLGTPSMTSISVSDVVVSRWQAAQANWLIATGVKPR